MSWYRLLVARLRKGCTDRDVRIACPATKSITQEKMLSVEARQTSREARLTNADLSSMRFDLADTRLRPTADPARRSILSLRCPPPAHRKSGVGAAFRRPSAERLKPARTSWVPVQQLLSNDHFAS